MQVIVSRIVQNGMVWMDEGLPDAFKEHQDQFIVLPCPENSPDLSPINNLWNPLDRVVRVMDPHARNLVQQ
ncbi:hypothetical protein TNCV_3095661 [Trichonephila clavipes]|nr:hypothetical protein TNCV_3095661 [Trichonephila clavipes]